jgi:hypothetical protein
MIKLSLIIFVLIPLLQCVGVFALNYSPLLDKIVINLAKSRVPSEVIKSSGGDKWIMSFTLHVLPRTLGIQPEANPWCRGAGSEVF